MSKLSFLLFPLALLFFHCKNDAAADKAKDAEVAPMTIDTITGAPIRQDNPWINRTCELISDAEFKALFGEEMFKTVNRTSLPDQSMCLITWMKDDWMQRESHNDEKGAEYQEPKNMLAMKIINYGTEVVSQQQFDMLNPESHADYDQTVVGLGDGAVWSTFNKMLAVKKGHLLLTITLEHTDNPIDNLPKAQEVARVALAKM